jgi:two-component system, cell cycle sensor histidine kinase and response regulator CckA
MVTAIPPRLEHLSSDPDAVEALDRLTRLTGRVLDVPMAVLFLPGPDGPRPVSRHGPELAEQPSLLERMADLAAPCLEGRAVDFSTGDEHPGAIRAEPVLIHALIAEPVRLPRGRHMGVLAAADVRQRRWSEDERAQLLELAAMVERELRLQGETRALEDAERWAQAQKRVMEQVARGSPLGEALDLLARGVEVRLPDLHVALLLVGEDGVTVHHAAAPSLPAGFVAALDGVRAVEGAASFGSAVARGRAVHTEDIAADPLWQEWGGVALAHGLRACWSNPLMDTDGHCLGAFALYRREPGLPGPREEAVIRQATSVAALAIGRARAQRARRLSEERLSLGLDGARAGVWDWTPRTGEVVRSPAMAGFLGIEPEEFEGALSAWEARVHPDDLPRVKVALEAHMAGRTPYYETEHRLRHRDGHWVWVRDRGKAVERDADGRPARVVGTVEDVTEERRRAEALRLLRTAVENLNDIVVVTESAEDPDTPGRVIFVNRAIERHIGRTPADYVGTTTDVILDQPHHRKVQREAREAVLRGESPRITIDVTSADGRTVWLEAVTQPLVDPQGRITHLVTVARPVNERIEAEREQERLVRALEEQQARLSTLLEQLPISVVLAEAPSGRVVMWNRAAEETARGEEMTAASTDEYDKWEAYLPDGTPMAAEDWPLARALAGETVHGEEFWSPDPTDPGRHRWWRIHAAPIRDRRGHVTAAVATSEEITDQRQVEEALRHSQEQLRHAQKMEAIGRLAGGMAHDFNNLLTAILGFGEFALEQLPSEVPLRADVSQIVEAALRGRSLTHQLLAFGRKSSWHAETVSINEVVETSRRLLHRVLGERVRVETDLDPASGLIQADPNHLEQALVNLALNARDALGEEGGTIEIRTEPVTLEQSLSTEPEVVPRGMWEKITVADDGPGMPAEIRNRVFEPFFTTKPRGRGTGLGLAMVYGIVKQAGGFVTVDSAQGRGTRIDVYLPRAEQRAPRDQEPRAHAAAGGLPGGVILLVEDQAQVRLLLARRLRHAGFEVIEAGDGREALQRFEAFGERPDLVLTDVVMPEMDGRALAAELARRAPEVPILFMSGYTGDREAAPGTPPIPEADLLVKPFGADEMLRRIAERLG